MKINEKNLCAHAASTSPIDKEGYLNKKGEVNKTFQRRYFVLKGNLLFYFEKKGDKEPIGVIVLEGCTLELVDDEEPFCFKIDFHGPNSRSFILGTSSHESMEQWMKALACSSYDYMKLMVAELQRQLDDIEDTPLEPPPHESPKPPPRHRHNPFDKVENVFTNNIPTNNTDKQDAKVGANITQVKISFAELHISYGRKITMDYNLWQSRRKLLKEKEDVNLISF